MRRLSVRDKVELKSQVKENSRNPEWNEHFRLLVYKPDQEVCTDLRVHVWTMFRNSTGWLHPVGSC